MKKIAILVPKGEVMPNAIVGAYFLLTQSNSFLLQQGRKPIFEVSLIGYESETSLYDGSFSVKTTSFKNSKKVFNILITPGFTCEMDIPIQLNQELITWMKTQYLQHHTELASMCTGAFLVAATGLLKGRECTSHWAFEQSFRQTFPEVNFLSEHIITDDNGFYASGGAYSSLNLILYLIEKFGSRALALWASKVFQLDIGRNSQKPFVIFNPQKSHADKQIAQVQTYIEQHFSSPISVRDLANRFAFSQRNFVRRFKDATNNTPIEYLQRVRMEAAKRLLETTTDNVNEIIYQTGYNDGKSFRSVFKKVTGYSPSQYRSRYGRGSVSSK